MASVAAEDAIKIVAAAARGSGLKEEKEKNCVYTLIRSGLALTRARLKFSRQTAKRLVALFIDL